MNEPTTAEVDTACYCDRCERRTKRFYRLSVACYTCRSDFTVRVRFGDRPGNPECPYCGNTHVATGALVPDGGVVQK